MADYNILARIQNRMVHTTAIVVMRSYILDIFHRGFIITSNDKSIVSLSFPVLSTLIQVKYHGIEKSPFITHSKSMNMALLSFLMYCYLAYGVNLRFDLHGNPPTYAFHCMVFFGNMAVASLATIFFPGSIWPLPYVLCVLVSAGEMLYWVYTDEQYSFRRRVYGFLISRWNRLFAYFTGEHTHILRDQQFDLTV